MDKHKKLLELFRETRREGKKAAIFSHFNPDPDSVASAAAIRLIAAHEGLEADIYLSGEIIHPQNKTLIEVLEFELYKPRKFEQFKGRNGYGLIIFTDITFLNDINGGKIDIKPDIIFDHHNKQCPPRDLKFCDIRKVGAVSSILSEYLKMTGFLNKENKLHARIATALFSAIKIDTNDMLSVDVTEEDRMALEYLLPFIDIEASNKIKNYLIPDYFYKYEKIAEDNKQIYGDCFITGLGYLKSGETAVLSYIAEHESRRADVSSMLVAAIVEDELLLVSFRSRNKKIDWDNIFTSMFGHEYSGVRDGSGGVKIPLSFIAGDLIKNNKDKKIIWESVFSKISDEIFKAVEAKGAIDIPNVAEPLNC